MLSLHIIDLNNAVSLITEIGFTDIATINFQTLSISYKKAFPSLVIAGLFSSPSVYYGAGFETKLYTDQTNF